MENTISSVIHYRVEGEGPWLVLSHSLACDLHMWDDDTAQLSRYYKVLRFDTHGHGESKTSRDVSTIDMLADDVVALLTELDVHSAHFIGLSMGGMIGQSIAIRHPDFLKSLVLCDTASELKMDISDRIAKVELHGMESMVEPTIGRFFSPSFIGANPEVINKVRNMIRSTSKAGYLNCCRAIASMDFTPDLYKISCPTLVLVGENDVVTPVTMAKALSENIPGASLEILPNAAHLANLEQPGLFTNRVIRFLANC